MDKIPPGPLPDPAKLADALDAIYQRRTELSHYLGFQLTVHRTLILLLAFERPVYSIDVSTAVRSLEGTPLYPKIRRIRHKHAVYQLLAHLAGDGWMTRVSPDQRDGVQFRLAGSVRGKLARVFDNTRDASGRPIWPSHPARPKRAPVSKSSSARRAGKVRG